MENKIGVLKRPSERTSEKKTPTFITGLLTILLIVSYVFTVKTYEPVKNIIISGGILIYPFTFLLIAYISKYYGFKEARKSVFISSGLFVIFVLLIVLCVIPEPNSATTSYNAVIQYLFTNDYFTLGETRIFYPLLGQFLGLILAYVVSHLIYSTVYNAIHRYTVDYLAMGLSVFIAAIIDRIIFIPLLYLENLLDGLNTFDYLIKCLTSEFMATIVFSIILIIIYIIWTSIVDKTKNKKELLKVD